MRILVLEDEKKIASFIKKGLDEQGYVSDITYDGNEAYHMASTYQYDALILDIMVPGRDGLSILNQLRSKNSSVPIIIITARTELNERLEGLNLGADDYISKPFYVEELIARLRNVLRRASNSAVNVLSICDLSIDISSRKVSRNNKPIMLTLREYSLLEYLMRSPGRVFTRTQIVEHVWESFFDSGTNLVDVYIRRLREKVDLPFNKKLLHTVRGIGYCLKEEN